MLGASVCGTHACYVLTKLNLLTNERRNATRYLDTMTRSNFCCICACEMVASAVNMIRGYEYVDQLKTQQLSRIGVRNVKVLRMRGGSMKEQCLLANQGCCGQCRACSIISADRHTLSVSPSDDSLLGQWF